MLTHLFIVFFSIVSFYYRPQRSWGKVIFSQACDSVHRGGAWSGGVGAWSRGVGLVQGCVSGPGGVPGLGGCAWSRGCLVPGGAWSWGVCMVLGGTWSGGCAWSGRVPGPGGAWSGGGGCLVPGGVPGLGGWPGPRGAWSQGVCMVRGGVPGPRGGLVETPPEAATAAGGTHPSGMHSCFIITGPSWRENYLHRFFLLKVREQDQLNNQHCRSRKMLQRSQRMNHRKL